MIPLTNLVTRTLVRRDFEDHNQHEGTRYDVLGKGDEPYDRDTVIGRAKFRPHSPFSNGLKGLDVVDFMEEVIDRSEIYLFDREELTETEIESLELEEKRQDILRKKQEVSQSE